MTSDPRGPMRKIVKVEETPSATLLTLDCGHAVAIIGGVLMQSEMIRRDPFQDKVPCFHQSEDAVRMKALLGMIDPFWSVLPCWDHKSATA